MADPEPLPEIDVEVLARQQEAGGVWLLDVRQPEEYEEGHLPGAVLIPLGELGARHGELPDDRVVYVVCQTGGRSAAAVEALNGAGHRTVNVAGGTMGWIGSGRPVVQGTEPGSP